MNGYLLDTDVVSMLAPSRNEAAPAFLDWLERMDAGGKLFLSVVTIHEIEKGIALLEHKGATAKAARLRAWLAGLVATYDDKMTRSSWSIARLPRWRVSLRPGHFLQDMILAWRTLRLLVARRRMNSSSSRATSGTFRLSAWRLCRRRRLAPFNRSATAAGQPPTEQVTQQAPAVNLYSLSKTDPIRGLKRRS